MTTPIPLYLEKSKINIRFKKLTNQEWFDIHQVYAPIFEDWDFLMFLDIHHYKETDFNLAKMYMTLFTLFGPHNSYDDYKCSFSYNFELEVSRKGKTLKYVLAFSDVKGNMPYFTYYRKPVGDENPDAYQKPIEQEFSKEEMRQCTLAFVAFLENFFRAYAPFFHQNFVRVVPYCYLTYGFQKNDFFMDFHPSEDEKDYEKFQLELGEIKKKKIFKTPMSKDFWKDDEVIEFLK